MEHLVRRPSRLGFTALLVALALCLFAVPSAHALSEDERNTIDIYNRTHAGVVNITSRAVSYGFLMQPIPTEASGSGSIIDKEGHILTNYHVIKDAQRLEVSLSDGSRYVAKVVGADPLTDLALLQIDAPPASLTPIPLGTSAGLKIGQKVLAIGNPFGLEQSLSTGVISSIRKMLRTGNVEIEGVIQTDAAINPGNSGGPLLDSTGKQIGVNTAIFTPSGGNIGIGFAVPIDTVKLLLDDLLKRGYVAYGYMGVGLDTLTPRLAQALRLPVSQGAIVTQVQPGGPADKAGLKPGTREDIVGNRYVVLGGDIVIEADGQVITDDQQLVRMAQRRKPGERMTLKVLRDGKTTELVVILGERPRQ